jgi:hypothetical protein
LSPQQVISIVDVHRGSAPGAFLLWRLPEALGNPRLYFRTIVELKASNHDAFRAFVKTQGAVDCLLDRYVPLLGPTTDVALLEIVMSLFSEKVDILSNPGEVADWIWGGVLAAIESSNATISAVAFRGALHLYSLTKFFFSEVHHEQWVDQLLTVTMNMIGLHTICVNFAMSSGLSDSRIATLCRMLMDHDSPDGRNLRLLSIAGIRSSLKSPLFLLRHIFEKGTSVPHLTLTAALSAAPILQKYFFISTVLQEWVRLFARTGFIFIAVSYARRKYRQRSITTLLFFEGLYGLGLGVLDSLFDRFWSTLVVARLIPDWPVRISSDAPWDHDLDRDILKAIESGCQMKRPLHNLQLPPKPKPSPAPRINPRFVFSRPPLIVSPIVSPRPTPIRRKRPGKTRVVPFSGNMLSLKS